MQTQAEIAMGRMPRYQKSLRLDVPFAPYFRQLLKDFPQIGFDVEAASETLSRLCVRRPVPAGECGCRYVIWVFGHGPRTRLVFGVQPRLLSFFFCGNSDVYEKLLGMEAHLLAIAQACSDRLTPSFRLDPETMIDG